MGIRRPDPELLRDIARFPLRRVVRKFEEYRNETLADGTTRTTFVGFRVELECGHIDHARGRKAHRCRACGRDAAPSPSTRGEPVKRMKWTRDPARPWLMVSDCGRFEIGGTVRPTPYSSDYLCLRDTLTGKEYPCRTDASAKAAARNLRTATMVTIQHHPHD